MDRRRRHGRGPRRQRPLLVAGATRRIAVGDLAIAYRRRGTGPPLVLLHGGVCDGREWEPVVPLLADAFDVVTWDAPGCGASDDPPPDLGMDGYADALAGLIAALALGRPHVAGLSFGGGLALALAGRHPGVPRSLVVVSGYAGWAGSLPAAEARARTEAALRQAEQPNEVLIAEWLPTLVDDATPPDAAARVLAMLRDVRPAGVRAMARAFGPADLRPALPAIAVPTLVVSGDADRRSPPAVARDIAARIPGAELVTLEGGHMLDLERADLLARTIRDFLGAPPAAPGGAPAAPTMA